MAKLEVIGHGEKDSELRELEKKLSTQNGFQRINMSNTSEVKPLIPESSTSESTTVEVILNDLRDKMLEIPDYQRDSDQWSLETKSLFVESIINNLSVPAFFFEVLVDKGVEKNFVVDGQQRLTTLLQFYTNKFQMVDSDDAPYLSPHSIHYAKKTFEGLPLAYQQAFKRYRLTIIKLRNMGDMRLEIFRRINQGGTPLSGQDIRLAYYGDKSPSLALMRLAGVYDPDRPGSKRFLERSQKEFSIEYPWKDDNATQCWKDWWEEKDISRGQTPSEAFLWSIVASQVEKLDAILQNSSALQTLNCRFNQVMDEALDVCCAQLHYQDLNHHTPPALMPFSELKDRFFPEFEKWVGYLLGQKGSTLPVTKHRALSAVIGAAYAHSINPSDLNGQQWTNLVEFIRHPQELARTFGVEYPKSKGRWGGMKGYRNQFKAVNDIVYKISHEQSNATES